MKLIESKTLATAAASIQFTSIPQTYTDLVAVLSLRDTATGNAFYASISLNSSTTGFTGRNLVGNSSVAGSDTTSRVVGLYSGNSTTANTFGTTQLYIPNYTGSTNKSFSVDGASENNSATIDTAYQGITAGLWSNTAAITSITFTSGGATFAIGSIISLYGILKGSDGIVTTS
jgi:hypothetical protein